MIYDKENNKNSTQKVRSQGSNQGFFFYYKAKKIKSEGVFRLGKSICLDQVLLFVPDWVLRIAFRLYSDWRLFEIFIFLIDFERLYEGRPGSLDFLLLPWYSGGMLQDCYTEDATRYGNRCGDI